MRPAERVGKVRSDHRGRESNVSTVQRLTRAWWNREIAEAGRGFGGSGCAKERLVHVETLILAC